MLKPRAHQQEFIDLFTHTQFKGLIAFHGMGLGKAQPMRSIVHTPDGPKIMGQIKVGDKVIGKDGKAKRVLQIHPQGMKKIFRVHFSDGTSTLCCDEHLWSVRTPKDKLAGKDFKVKPLSEIRKKLKDSSGNNLWQIPITEAVEYPLKEVNIPAYTLGVLLGDGGLTGKGVNFTNASRHIIERVEFECQFLPDIYIKSEWQERINSFRNSIQSSDTKKNVIKRAIDSYGLNVKAQLKHIPSEYKYNSIHVRLGVLSGLIDTDGYVSKDGTIQFSSSSKQLAQDVAEIVQSLGGIATLSHKKTNIDSDSWTLTLKIPREFLPWIITKPEKRDRVKPLTKYLPSRTIVDVTEEGTEYAQCISVEDEHYLTDSYIVTHNTYTTLLLARYYLAIARQQGYHAPKFLVLCPKSAITTWRAECAKLTPDIARDMVLLPYSQLKRAVKMIASSVFPWVLMGLDECHYLKTPDTNRIKDFANLLMAIARSKHGDIIKVMPMTGTPFPNNAAEIYTMWALCTSPSLEEASRRILDERYFEMWRGGFTNRKDITIKRKDPFIPGRFTFAQATQYEGVANSDLMHQLISPVIHYKRKEDCLDLPPAIIQYINLELPDDKLLANANIEKPDAYMSQLRVISEAKTPYMLEWIGEFLKLGEQLVVFSLFTTPLRILAQKYPSMVRLITGQESQVERDDAVRAFQNGKLKVIALSYKAGSESLNLQNAHNSFYLNFPWNDDTLKQAMARTDRSGQSKTTNHYFMMSGENDIQCFQRVERKRLANEEIKERLLADNKTGEFRADMLSLLEVSNDTIRERTWEQAVDNAQPAIDLSFGGLI